MGNEIEPSALEEYLRLTPLVPLTEATIVEPDRLRADLEQVRRRGYALGHGERDPWAASVAAPFRAADGRVAGSLSVCGPLGRFEPDVIDAYARVIVQACERLSDELGSHPAPTD